MSFQLVWGVEFCNTQEGETIKRTNARARKRFARPALNDGKTRSWLRVCCCIARCLATA